MHVAATVLFKKLRSVTRKCVVEFCRRRPKEVSALVVPGKDKKWLDGALESLQRIAIDPERIRFVDPTPQQRC